MQDSSRTFTALSSLAMSVEDSGFVRTIAKAGDEVKISNSTTDCVGT